ncbi:MAG TPA: NADH-quinone oxidoreductase subunit D, partial [Thermotogota bacterium]|nr:NADH-quinone oxidoreductase subunit D [Thermotogota bacterium]
PYELYDEFDFKIPVGKNGDCYDRYLIRCLEMRESVKIIQQAIDHMDGEGQISEDLRQSIGAKVKTLCARFPLYKELL